MTGVLPGGGLTALRDLDGVEGSFLFSLQGGVLDSDIPSIFGDRDVLEEVAPRLLRLVETFSDSGAEVHSYIIRFREHLLFLRNTQRGMLCVLSAPDVNLPALRMGVNLALRRMASAPEPRPDRSTPTEPVPAAVASAQAPAPGPATIQWRGSVVTRR
jgi:predicted regulator of Ras-like GTPase activity (Roadblock/LC7/MglB family)